MSATSGNKAVKSCRVDFTMGPAGTQAKVTGNFSVGDLLFAMQVFTFQVINGLLTGRQPGGIDLGGLEPRRFS